MTFLLNVFRRPEALERQIESIRHQTVPPSAVMIWQNDAPLPDVDFSGLDVQTAQCSDNLGVWARLAYALNAETEYVCMLDDDTVPGSRWIENCLGTLSAAEGLLGTRGLRFKSRRSYLLAEEIGWQAPNDSVERVDIVGHAWFFRSEWLQAFWSVPRFSLATAGEDFHFSFALQHVLGLGTYVPAHPAHDRSLWGADPETSLRFGVSEQAVSASPGAQERFQRAFRFYVDAGLVLVKSPTLGSELSVTIEGLATAPRVRRTLGGFRWARRLWTLWHEKVLRMNA